MEVSRKQLIELVKIAKRETKGSKPRTPIQLVKAFENSINESEPSQRALHENKEVKVCETCNGKRVWRAMDNSMRVCLDC